MKAKFEFTDIPADLPGHSIVLRDISATTSITADAAEVLRTVLRVAGALNEPIGPDLPPVYYYGNLGELVQLLHDGENVIGFSSAEGAPHGGD